MRLRNTGNRTAQALRRQLAHTDDIQSYPVLCDTLVQGYSPPAPVCAAAEASRTWRSVCEVCMYFTNHRNIPACSRRLEHPFRYIQVHDVWRALHNSRMWRACRDGCKLLILAYKVERTRDKKWEKKKSSRTRRLTGKGVPRLIMCNWFVCNYAHISYIHMIWKLECV